MIFKKYNTNKFTYIKNNKMLFYKISWLFIISLLLIITFFIGVVFTGSSFRWTTSEWIKYNTLLRTLSSFFVGFSLAIVGCGMQGVTRNSLSGPTTLGILPASTLGIMIAEVFGLTEIYYILIFAFILAFLTILINFVSLKIKAYQTESFKSILVGLITGSILTSAALILKGIYPNISENIVIWLGSSNSNNYTWERFYYCAPLMLIGIIMIFFTQNKINIIEKDISLAVSLGINIKLVYWVIGIASVLISISSVVLLGSIVIVGIVIPHIVRMLLKTRDYRWVMPISGILSATSIIIASLLNIITQWGMSIFTIIFFLPIFLFIFIRGKTNVNK